MIIIGILCIVIAILVLPFAWRGKVVARGQFCRKCRFDLAGSPMDSIDDKCSECGRVIHTQTSRRTSLRQSSRAGLILSVVILLFGITSAGIGISGNSAAIYAQMPDGIIVRLTVIGSDDALDDLVLRLSRTTPLSNAHWGQLVTSGLAHQAQTTSPWDPRWGEVLYTATVDGHLSEHQLKQYVLNGFTHSVRIRDRVHQGDQGVGYKLSSMQERLSGLTGGSTGYNLRIAVNQSGVVGRTPKYKDMGGGVSHLIEIKARSGTQNWTQSLSSRIQSAWLNRPMFNVEPGSVVEVYVDYEVQMTRKSDDSTVFEHYYRAEQAITVLSKTTPIVQTITPSPEQLAECGHSLSPINLINQLPETVPSYGIYVMAAHLSLEMLSEPFAFRAYFVIDTEEIEFGTMNGIVDPTVTSIHVIHWQVNQANQEAAQRTIGRIHANGRVDIVLRADAIAAIDNPDIQQVLGLTLRFDDVPVESIVSDSNLWTVRRDSKVAATCQSD